MTAAAHAALGFGLLLWVILGLMIVALCSCIGIWHSSGAIQYAAIFMFVCAVVAVIVLLSLPPDLLW